MAGNELAFTLIEFAILLNLKHLICEFIVQTPHIAESKMRYGSINSIIHLFHHAFGTLVVGLLVDFNIGLTLGLIAVESLLHYHIDWLHMKFGAHSYKDKRYWQWLGIEQFLHYQTYMLMIILARYVLINHS